MTTQFPILDEASLRTDIPCNDHQCCGETVIFETPFAREVHLRCAPTNCPNWREEFAEQAESFYRCLPGLLARAGGDPGHVISERAFFENFARDLEVFEPLRAAAYREAGVSPNQQPALTCIQQPPCRRSQKLEMQVYAVVPKRPGDVSVQTFRDETAGVIIKLWEIAGARRLLVSNLQGVAASGAVPRDFRSQCDLMFEHSRRILAQFGARFPDVLRTWCYLAEMDRDYAEFNRSRNDFFAREGVRRLPASTGIEAELWPSETLCSIDLYALLNPEAGEIRVMHTPTLNEAPEYGSAFSRGMRVDLPDKTELYISGTASVDESGKTVHVGDVAAQIDRMLLNIEKLLEAQGASFADLVQASSYLKSACDLELYERKLEAWGVRRLPNTLVEAGVCRPELLCEMEAIAVLPRRRN